MLNFRSVIFVKKKGNFPTTLSSKGCEIVSGLFSKDMYIEKLDVRGKILGKVLKRTKIVLANCANGGWTEGEPGKTIILM